ncbi:BRO-B [Parapoynx stagnalis nucleopolyhedrovirus]|uniref:BRO-B n=1 Tax=Parapoynx stagnalis nucleopolyhedrovirus TaxID=2993413 RepID=A0A9E7YIR0_9ABAC|nr:BRO-B [Parapoynx stagnalis nucleopolyhedrovirus]
MSLNNSSSPETTQFEKISRNAILIKDEQLRKNSELIEKYTILLEEKINVSKSYLTKL